MTAQRVDRYGPACAWLVFALMACGPSTPAGRPGPGVLLIAVDGLRADHLACLGYDRETTPNLDALAAEGALFTSALSAAPWLLPAHVALLTGCDPSVAAWRPDLVEATVEYRWKIPDRVPRLAARFLVAGYATAAFMEHEWLAPVYGFRPGFQVFSEHDAGAPDPRGGLLRKSRELVQWLDGLGDGTPWFAYLHVHDLERLWGTADPEWDNYFEERPGLETIPPVSNADRAFFAVPRARWQGGSVSIGRYEARYDGALRRMDTELGILLEMLRLAGRLETTTICLVGTHGLQFGEAGMILDHGLLSVADLRVPWILRAPGAGIAPGTRVGELASLVDVAPTLLELAGLEPLGPVPVQGVSQVGTLRGGPAARRFAFAACGLQYGWAVFGEELAWEHVLPGNTAGDALRMSWYGDDLPHLRETLETVYDWRKHPFPLRSPEAHVDPALVAPLAEAYSTYVGQLVETRRSTRPEPDDRTLVERFRAFAEGR